MDARSASLSVACDCPPTRSGAHLHACIYGPRARAHEQTPCVWPVVRDYGLSKRETEAATLLGRGATNTEIAAALGVQLQGAKDLMSAVMRKTASASRTEAALRLAGVLK
jgi:DNA-binding NarL/FixJ family response regulator